MQKIFMVLMGIFLIYKNTTHLDFEVETVYFYLLTFVHFL